MTFCSFVTPPAAFSINDRSVSGIACHTRPYSAAVMTRRLATASLDESRIDLMSDFDKILPSGVRMPEVPRIQPVGFFFCGVFRRFPRPTRGPPRLFLVCTIAKKVQDTGAA